MDSFMDAMKDVTNFGYTENHAIKHKTTKSAILDMFAMCGSYRNRTDEDCILAFKNALDEDISLAMKCLFYLRDIRGGQGERRFFRVCFRWLINNKPEVAFRNLKNIPEYGRWDDLIYTTIDTEAQADALDIIKNQLALDVQSKTPSLLAKWLPSENASAKKTKRAATIIRKYLNMTHREYRKMLSNLRSKINIVEKLMSQNRWDKIDFSKIPSRAGLIYKNAFSRRDIIAKKYESFAKDTSTTVNAGTLNPVDIASKIFNGGWNIYGHKISDTDRAMLQKYWENQIDYYHGREENGIAIVDTSGSMLGIPICAAVSMGAYIAEKSHGPFANHFITFSSHPELVKFEGVDIVDKFQRCTEANWGINTNIKAVFDMLLRVAKQENTKPEDIPQRLYVFSDMEFDHCGFGNAETVLEQVEREWNAAGYELPKVIFWNLDARSQNIPALGGRFSYVSGFSMSMVETILSGKDGWDLCLEKLMSERYAAVN